MTYQDVNNLIASFGLPYAYYQFPDNTKQATPFVCFFYPNSNDLYADQSNYQRITALAIELYTANKDFANEANIEAKLNEAGLTYIKSETYLDSERLFEVIYETEVLINAEQG